MTKEIRLTQGKVALVDDVLFGWLNQFKWFFRKDGYVAKSIYNKLTGERKQIRMHREIMNFPDGMEIDHINGDKLDNRRENLRICTMGQNRANRGLQRNSSSGYKGVYFEEARNKWRAQIEINNRRLHLGYFNNAEKAAFAYDTAAKKYFGEFAKLNFPEVKNV